MSSFPRITSPCPLRIRAMPEPGRDWCAFCAKRVHNLDLMTEAKRAGLLARGEQICVAYTVKRAATAALASAGLAAALASTGCMAMGVVMPYEVEPQHPFVRGEVKGLDAGSTSEAAEFTEVPKEGAPAER